MFNSRRHGFTLIELLVVVTIISILAVIALPNFAEAQTRAKVAAVKNNMRHVGSKFEMLNVDTNRYPMAGRWRWILLYRVPYWVGGESPDKKFLNAYKSMYGPRDDLFEAQAMKDVGMQDHQWLGREDLRELCHGFGFFHPQNMIDVVARTAITWEDFNEENWSQAKEAGGDWILYSPGPDLVVESPNWITDMAGIKEYTNDKNYNERRLFHTYDPTNGTYSYGNIFRSQKNAAGIETREYFYR